MTYKRTKEEIDFLLDRIQDDLEELEIEYLQNKSKLLKRKEEIQNGLI